MFVSIDQAEDKKYENETRNIFALQRYNSRQKWQQSILDEDNSKVFETELIQTLVDVNRFITKIEIESALLNHSSRLKEEDEKKFKEYLAMGRELITKLKVLVTLEKASAMEEYEQSRIRKLSYAASEDTASGVDTESVGDGRAGFSREESFERRDSRTITLVHKYAASFTRHYEVFDKLNHDVEEIVDRFNSILDFIHQQLQLKTTTGVLIKEETTGPAEEMKSEFETVTTRPSFDSVDSVTYGDLNFVRKENESQALLPPDTKMAVDILKEHLARTSLSAVYKHIHTSGTGHLIEHTYNCSVAGLYSEGKSRKRSKAKEEAATQMMRQLIRRQHCDNLPPEIIPFADYQVSQISALLDEREDFIDQLEETCLQLHEPPPLYTVLKETGKSNEPYFTIKCEAMGYTAVGHASIKMQARKNSAKSILNLVSRSSIAKKS